jgi:hypothetical protein
VWWLSQEAEVKRFKEGDRVVKAGWKSRNEPDRAGVVVDCYYGHPSTQGEGVAMVVVKWDDTGTTAGGYLQNGELKLEGSLE